MTMGTGNIKIGNTLHKSTLTSLKSVGNMDGFVNIHLIFDFYKDIIRCKKVIVKPTSN